MRDGQFSMYSTLIVQLGPITLLLATAYHSLIFFTHAILPLTLPLEIDIKGL